jgi:hypothetical protein
MAPAATGIVVIFLVICVTLGAGANAQAARAAVRSAIKRVAEVSAG